MNIFIKDMCAHFGIQITDEQFNQIQAATLILIAIVILLVIKYA